MSIRNFFYFFLGGGLWTESAVLADEGFPWLDW